jgi:uncharacterized coiled-coil protein SlyX
MASLAAFIRRLFKCEQRATLQHRTIADLTRRITALEQQLKTLQSTT